MSRGSRERAGSAELLAQASRLQREKVQVLRVIRPSSRHVHGGQEVHCLRERDPSVPGLSVAVEECSSGTMPRLLPNNGWKTVRPGASAEAPP